MSGIRKMVSRWLRIGSKIFLARLPFPYSFWKRLGLFEHGDMDQPKRALDTFIEHGQTGQRAEPDDDLLVSDFDIVLTRKGKRQCVA